MSILRRALGNTAIMLVAQLITWSATLLTTAVLGAQLGVAAFGTLYLAMSFSLLFSVLVEFGLNQQLVRAISARPRTCGSLPDQCTRNQTGTGGRCLPGYPGSYQRAGIQRRSGAGDSYLLHYPCL